MDGRAGYCPDGLAEAIRGKARPQEALAADLIAGAVQVGKNVLLAISEGETVTIRHFDIADLDSREFML